MHASAPECTEEHSISVRDAEVAGSNPAFPTTAFPSKSCGATADAVAYARQQIQAARRQIADVI